MVKNVVLGTIEGVIIGTIALAGLTIYTRMMSNRIEEEAL